VDDYLCIRRALGFTLVRAEKLLARFVTYAAERDVDVVTVDLAVAWAMSPAAAGPRWWDQRLSTVRGFAAYLNTLDPRVGVPPPGLIRCGPPRTTPYLYTDAEITALVQAAGARRPVRP
jgi:integrase/recombinase XerD